MNTIKNNTNNEIIIKNSRFICFLYKINNLDDINNIFNIIKQLTINKECAKAIGGVSSIIKK